jgi:glycosyltransferase involved in cell wall biosynthesis
MHDKDMADYADWKNQSFNGKLNDVCNKTFTARAISEVARRIQHRDFLLCWYGTGHQRVADKFNGSMIVVEPTVYTFKSFAPFRVFGSYALMHHIYGQENIKPRVYDAVIPGFIDPSDFRYSNQKEDWLLYLGRVEPLKGVLIAIDVARRTGRKLKIAGQGTLKEVPPFVEMVGYANAAMKADLLSRTAALVQPSLYSEPFGYNVIEASMSGTPVITSDWGGFTETVLHGITGWRCRNMDQFDWAVRHLDQIKPKACLQWALNNYTIDHARERYEEYFRQLRGVFFGCDFNGSDPERTAIVGATRRFVR